MPFLFIYIFALGLSTVELLIGIVISFPVLIIVINLLGRLSDKHGRKKFIPISIMITSTMLFLIPFIKVNDQINLILFYVILPFLLIIILGLDTPMNTWSQDLIPEDSRGKFFGLLNIIYTLPQIIGAFIGGFVATYFIIAGFIPESFIFIFAPIFFMGSIPIFLRVKETSKKE